MKKIISVILALALLCPAAVWAVSSLFSLDAGRTGDEITVTVTLHEEVSSEGATMLQGEVYYDPDILTPVSVVASADYDFLSCVISQREPRVQFSHVSPDSESLSLPAGTVVTIVFETSDTDDAELRLEMDLQTADGSVVVDLTEYATITACTGHEWDGLTCIHCGATRENPFTDVPEGSFYFLPVLWAVDEGITNGATATTFNPTGDLLRAQVVVMLWRAAGSPEPETKENPFTDVKETDFYYKAVLWAVEEGITNGTSATTFGPMGITNRAQVVTFLWRYAGKPASDAENPFADVDESAWYGAPVLWAVENGITNGMSQTQFGVNANCNRAHMVTFLYRAMN